MFFNIVFQILPYKKSYHNSRNTYRNNHIDRNRNIRRYRCIRSHNQFKIMTLGLLFVWCRDFFWIKYLKISWMIHHVLEALVSIRGLFRCVEMLCFTKLDLRFGLGDAWFESRCHEHTPLNCDSNYGIAWFKSWAKNS